MNFFAWLRSLFSKKPRALPVLPSVVPSPAHQDPDPLPVILPPEEVLPEGFATAPDADGRVVFVDLKKKNADCLFLSPLTLRAFSNLTDRQRESISQNCGCNPDGSVYNPDGTPVPFYSGGFNAAGQSAVEFFSSNTGPVSLVPRYNGASDKVWKRVTSWPDLAKGVKTVAARFDNLGKMVAYANTQPDGRVGPVEFPTDPGRAKIS